MTSSTGITLTALVMLGSVALGCGREQGAVADVAAADTAAASTTTEAAPAAATAAAPAEKPAPKLTSLPSTPVPAGDLRDAYFHWKGAEVTFAGYPATFFDEDHWSGVSAFTAVPEKGAQELVDCSLTDPPEEKVARTTPVVLRGTVRARSWATPGNVPVLQMEDCEVVSTGEAVAAAGDPWRLDGRPVPVKALYDAALGWQGKRVQVVGRYDSSTHSSAGDVQRHDIADASGKKAVACTHQGNAAAPAAAVQERDGVIVEGLVGEPFFDQVTLQECRFVNRS